MINVHVGRLKDTPVAIYRDTWAANTVMALANYKAHLAGVTVYNGEQRPLIQSTIDGNTAYGNSLRKDNGYILSVYHKDKPETLCGYITFINDENNRPEPFPLIDFAEWDNPGTLLAHYMVERILTAIKNQTNTEININDTMFEKGLAELCAIQYEIAGSQQALAPRLNLPDYIIDEVERLRVTDCLTHDYSLLTITGENSNVYYIAAPVHKGNRISEFILLIPTEAGEIITVSIGLKDVVERIFVKDEPTVSELLTTESVTRSHLKFHPVINLLQEEYNISSEKALELMEMAATENPFLLLEYTIPSMFTTEDDYLHTLAENLTLACELTESNTDLFADAVVYEDMQSKARELGAKIHDAGSKAKRKAVAAGKAVNAVANPIAKAVKAVIDGAKDYMNDSAREEAITGSTFSKLRNLFIKCIAPTAAIALTGGVAITIVAFLGTLALNKKLNLKSRAKVKQELEMELRMVREKIEDAKSAGDNEKKYQLMRIENKIDTQLADIKRKML